MRVVFLGNNLVGVRVLEFLNGSDDEIVGAILHPVDKRQYGEEILDLLDVPSDRIVEGPALEAQETAGRVRDWGADIAVSVLFDYILKPSFIELFAHGCVNLHPSLLPYNRGQFPNVWSIVEGTPAGATLHYIDEGVDTGDLISQHEIPVAAHDTGETLYRKLEEACVTVFRETWPALSSGNAPRHTQSGQRTYHRTGDVDLIDEIDLETTYTAWLICRKSC